MGDNMKSCDQILPKTVGIGWRASAQWLNWRENTLADEEPLD